MGLLIKVMVLTGVILVAASTVGYLWMRSRTGSLDIQLPHLSYEPSENVEGTLRLHLKRAVSASELTLTLIGEQAVVPIGGEEGFDQRHQSYRHSLTLAGACSYGAGETIVLPFVFEVPPRAQLDLVPSARFEMNWTLEASLPTDRGSLRARAALWVRYRE